MHICLCKSQNTQMNVANTHHIDWDDLRIFNAIAAAGSLRAASRHLAVNHSTVFRRLNRLEQAMGARLFDRLPQGYVLTGTGEALREHVRRIGDEVDVLQLRLMGQDHRPSGTIRVTAPDNIAYTYLPRHFAAFQSEYPGIVLELMVGGESLDLSRREADVAVRATQKPPAHLIGRKVCSLAWAFYASPDYLERSGAPASQADLAGHRLIAGEGALAQLPAMRWMDKHHAEQIVARGNTLNAISALAVAAVGIALMPDDQLKPELERLFSLKPKVVSDLWILTHPELRRTERVRLLVRFLLQRLREDDRLLQTHP